MAKRNTKQTGWKEIRDEAFKQGIWQERDRIIKLIKKVDCLNVILTEELIALIDK